MWNSGWFVPTSVTTLFCKAWTYSLTASHRDVVCVSFTHIQVYRMFVSWGNWRILAFPVALGIVPRALSTQGSTMRLQPQSHLCFESRDRDFWIILSFPGWPWSQKSLIPGWPQTDSDLHQLPEELRPQVCLHHQAPLTKFSIFFLCGLGVCVGEGDWACMCCDKRVEVRGQPLTGLKISEIFLSASSLNKGVAALRDTLSWAWSLPGFWELKPIPQYFSHWASSTAQKSTLLHLEEHKALRGAGLL